MWRLQNQSGLTKDKRIQLFARKNNDRYDTMKCQLQSMSGILLGTCCKMSATINKCLVLYLEMLGTYPIAGIQVLKCS